MCRVRDGPSISAKAAPLRWEGAYIYIIIYIIMWNSLDMAVTLTTSTGVLALPVFLMHSLWMLFVPEPLASLFTFHPVRL